jgi:thioredoxin-related protein
LLTSTLTFKLKRTSRLLLNLKDAEMDKLTRKVELFSNVAIIILAILLGTVLVRKYLLTQPAQSGNNAIVSDSINTGTKVNLRDMDWSKNKQTLVLVLSSSCHFCSESAPFYQRLIKERGSNIHLVAVLPQTISEGENYLNSLGVSVDEIRQASLSSINVRGTPTLMLVNGDGVVVSQWVGRLPQDQEAEVLSKIQSNRAGN